jgi:hypothetical protein
VLLCWRQRDVIFANLGGGDRDTLQGF